MAATNHLLRRPQQQSGVNRSYWKIPNRNNALRKNFDDKRDDWQWSLVHTFQEYLRSIDTPPDLYLPVSAMLLDIEDNVRDSRGDKKTMMSASKHRSMCLAAAAVTVFKGRRSYPKMDEAAAAVARAIGLRKKEIGNFRDNINRALYSAEILDAYKLSVSRLEEISDSEILTILRNARIFVSGDA